MLPGILGFTAFARGIQKVFIVELYQYIRTNKYGYPGKETLLRLDSFKIPKLTTIESGEITVLKKSGRLMVRCFKD